MLPQDGERYRDSADDVAEGRLPSSGGSPEESELARRFWDRLRVFAARRLGDAAAAEDVAQETLRRVVEALRADRIRNPDALPAFVFQTARNICLHRYRSASREARAMSRFDSVTERHSTAPDPLIDLVSEERRRVVRAAMARLDSDDRALLRMFFYEDSDTADVARQLDATPAAIRVRKHRALRRLSRELEGLAS